VNVLTVEASVHGADLLHEALFIVIPRSHKRSPGTVAI
jgi:hypothetical protein